MSDQLRISIIALNSDPNFPLISANLADRIGRALMEERYAELFLVGESDVADDGDSWIATYVNAKARPLDPLAIYARQLRVRIRKMNGEIIDVF